jgi:hypothetical protein
MANDPSVLVAQLKELKRWVTNDFSRLAAVQTQNWVRGNFKRQSYGVSGAKWKERADGDTSRGLLFHDQSSKKKISPKAFMRDIIFAAAVGQQITISINRIYAQVHNEGGTIVQNVTDKQRGFFWAKHYEAKKAQQAVQAERWKRMALSKTLTLNMPMRQFMPMPNQGVPDELANIFAKDIEKKIDGIFK